MGGWLSTAYPAGWVTVSSAKHGHLFLDTDTLAFTLSGSAAVAYEVRNYYGATVATGSVAGTALTLAALPRGWYRLLLYQAGSDATYGTLIGATMFSVIAPDARLLAPPAAGTTVGAGTASEGIDHAMRGLAVSGAERLSINDASAPTTGTGWRIASAIAEHGYAQTFYHANPDAARPRPAFCAFPNGGTATQAHLDGVTATVQALYPQGVTYFEGPANEPQGTAAATVAASMQAFKTAAKAGNAAAKVMGPNPVGYNGANGGLNWLDQFLAAGGAAGLDAISVHQYNCNNGDITLTRRAMDGLKATLAKYGLQNTELWQTEWGTFACTYGVYNPRRQARWMLLSLLMLEQAGIPKERIFWFYDTSHGFWTFPSWLKNADGTMNPAVALMRVYSQELFGKTHQAQLDFGTVENDFYVGSRFQAADGSAALVLISGGRTDGTVALQLTGATSVVTVDCFGTTTTRAADAKGIVAVPVTCEPVYVRLPAGVSASVVQVAYGPNIARWTPFGTSLGTVDPQRALNGTLENWYYQGSSEPTEWRDDAALPASLAVRFNAAGTRPHRIDTVIIHCPTPWQEQGTLLDYDVEYKDVGGTWHTLQTTVEPAPTFATATNQSQLGCAVEHYHSGRCVFVHKFAVVTAIAVRVTARNTTFGGETTQAAIDAGGQGGSQKLRIRELAVYCSDSLVPRPVVLF